MILKADWRFRADYRNVWWYKSSITRI